MADSLVCFCGCCRNVYCAMNTNFKSVEGDVDRSRQLCPLSRFQLSLDNGFARCHVLARHAVRYTDRHRTLHAISHSAHSHWLRITLFMAASHRYTKIMLYKDHEHLSSAGCSSAKLINNWIAGRLCVVSLSVC